jgi:SAM-dependent methyltransferase
MLARLKAFYQHQLFFPSAAGIFLNPFYLARSALHQAMKDMASGVQGRLLDIGCGTKPYQQLFAVTAYIGLDIDSDRTRSLGVADHLYDGGQFPFENDSFDSALCNQVLEHVFNPDEFLEEVRRVLKPGGRLLLTIPFVWDEHEQPYDFARYSSFGLAVLLRRHGFDIERHIKLRADMSVIFQLVNAYLFKVTLQWPKPLKLLLYTTVMALNSLMGLTLGRLLPGNPDLYLDNVVLAVRTS